MEGIPDLQYKMIGILRISTFALQLLYECEDCEVFECHIIYECTLTDYSPLIDFSALGYCIAHSRCEWSLQLRQDAHHYGMEMQSEEGIEMLANELKRYGDFEAHYSIRYSCYPPQEFKLHTTATRIISRVCLFTYKGTGTSWCSPSATTTMYASSPFQNDKAASTHHRISYT